MKFWWWVRSLVLTLIVVPLLAHGVVFICAVLHEFLNKIGFSPTVTDSVLTMTLFYVLGGMLMFVAGWLLARFTPAKENNALRQILLLLPALWVLTGWVVVLQLTGFSFYSHWYDYFFTAMLPWVGINFIALFSGGYWMMVIIPAGTQVCFTLGCYWRNRRIPDSQKTIKLRNRLVVVLIVLTLIAAWQAMLRLELFPSVDRDTALTESIDTWNYDPRKENNKLTKLRGAAPFTFTIKHPRFDGATAAYPLFASAFFALNTFANDMPFDEIQKSWLGISRTPDAYKNIIDDRADIIFVAQPSEGQKKRAQEANVKLTYTPFAREAFVFITHVDNPINDLTQQQVRDIFSGKKTHWNQVGGEYRKIQVWQRPEDSGSQSTMLAKVMKDTPMLPPRETEVARGMGGIMREVAEYQNSKGAIGYTFRYYATKMNPTEGIKILAIDGVAPTAETIRDGSYPFAVDVYMVTRDDTNEKAQKIVRWFLSPQGQSLVEDVGYVPLYSTVENR